MLKLCFALLLCFVLIAGSFGVSLWVMMVGWGVSPASWGVIIGGFFIQLVLLALIELAKGIFKD